MEKNADSAAVARNEARGALRVEKEERRGARLEALRGGVVDWPQSRFARKVGVVLLDERKFREWVEERGGEESAVGWLCAQAAEGVLLRTVAEHYGLDYGLLWDLLARDMGRLDRYYRALRGVADELVLGTLEIAHSESPDVVRDKLKVDTHFRVAGKLDRARFGEEKQVGAPGVPVINFVMVSELPQAQIEVDVTPQTQADEQRYI